MNVAVVYLLFITLCIMDKANCLEFDKNSYVRISFPGKIDPSKLIEFSPDPEHLIDGSYVYILKGQALSPRNIFENNVINSVESSYKDPLKLLGVYYDIISSADPKGVLRLYEDANSKKIVKGMIENPSIIPNLLKGWSEFKFFAPVLIYECEPKEWLILGFTSKEDMEAKNTADDTRMLMTFGMRENDLGQFSLTAGDTCECLASRNITSALGAYGIKGISLQNVKSN